MQLISDAAERLWNRLITSVDDFGRMEADPEVVFTTCFQRVPKGWSVYKVGRCLHELATLRAKDQDPLILIYQSGPKSYLQIISAHVHIYRRAKDSKYPDPSSGIPHLLSAREITNEGGCAQVRADSLELRTPNSELRSSNPDLIPMPADDGIGARFQEFWQAYPARNGKKLEKGPTEALFVRLSIQDQALAVVAARNYAEALKAQGISAKDPKRFFKDEYWREWTTPGKADPVKTSEVTPPKYYQPASTIDRSNAVEMPPEVAETLSRLMGGMRMRA